MEKIAFYPLEESGFDEIVSAFKMISWNKPRNIYETYFKEQADNTRSVIVAKENGKFCGYVTIKWKSDYGSFAQQNIPEISDLNVLPNYRNHGIGTALINACEMMAKERGYKKIGLGVGMTADYGNAQRLYSSLGYRPDGHGLHYKYAPLNHGDKATIDDDLVLFMTKSLISNNFKLIRCNDEKTVSAMHDIREKILFTSGKYDRHHADDKNPNNHCFIFLLSNKPVATVRLDFIEPNKAAVRLVAVLPEHQGQKIGSKMLFAIEDYAKQRGITKLVTNSAVNAKSFYEAIGYVSESWVDPGEGISQPTIPMTKTLIR